jgi:hypothetical protein
MVLLSSITTLLVLIKELKNVVIAKNQGQMEENLQIILQKLFSFQAKKWL